MYFCSFHVRGSMLISTAKFLHVLPLVFLLVNFAQKPPLKMVSRRRPCVFILHARATRSHLGRLVAADGSSSRHVLAPCAWAQLSHHSVHQHASLGSAVRRKARTCPCL